MHIFACDSATYTHQKHAMFPDVCEILFFPAILYCTQHRNVCSVSFFGS